MSKYYAILIPRQNGQPDDISILRENLQLFGEHSELLNNNNGCPEFNAKYIDKKLVEIYPATYASLRFMVHGYNSIEDHRDKLGYLEYTISDVKYRIYEHSAKITPAAVL